jgi:hypothetical protein
VDNDFTDRLRALANLETIRAARIEPLLLKNNKLAGLNETSEVLKLPRFRPERIHVITNICAIEIGTDTPQVFLGILSSGIYYPLFADTVTTAEDSVNWSGQAICLAGTQIYAEFQSATAAEEIILTANGYSMRI